MISDQELYLLSFYRASELAGALLFGKLAFHTTIDEIRVPLTRHCLEEAEHAWLWTRTITDLGRTPLKVTQTYQGEYGREFGMPQDTIELLCLTQVLEKRVLAHFEDHARAPGTHPRIRQTLEKMIEDEVGHIGWVRTMLDGYAQTGDRDRLARVMADLEAIDRRAYDRLAVNSPFGTYFAAVSREEAHR